ncbi:hypothetical protein, partial [Allokutzneria sp. NRRL B-24872]|uniref:hypothetical protein n=1 Tax=Allokutzneria sp. NRRL B-24872 TaxID=1137961 RepID=UPI001FED3E87
MAAVLAVLAPPVGVRFHVVVVSAFRPQVLDRGVRSVEWAAVIQIAAVCRLLASDRRAPRVAGVDEFSLFRRGTVGVADFLRHAGGGVGQDAFPDTARCNVLGHARRDRSVSGEHPGIIGQAEQGGHRHRQVDHRLALRGGGVESQQQVAGDVGAFLVQRSVVFGETARDAVDVVISHGGVVGGERQAKFSHAVVEV